MFCEYTLGAEFVDKGAREADIICEQPPIKKVMIFLVWLYFPAIDKFLQVLEQQ